MEQTQGRGMEEKPVKSHHISHFSHLQESRLIGHWKRLNDKCVGLIIEYLFLIEKYLALAQRLFGMDILTHWYMCAIDNNAAEVIQQKQYLHIML